MSVKRNNHIYNHNIKFTGKVEFDSENLTLKNKNKLIILFLTDDDVKNAILQIYGIDDVLTQINNLKLKINEQLKNIGERFKKIETRIKNYENKDND